jgi:hypothetical protein
MSWLLPALMFLILFACVAMCYADGLWSNAVRLINVVTAGLLATNFFEPLADWLDGMQPTYTYFWDFLSLWGLFFLIMGVMRLLTDSVSKVKVRFLKIVDRIGSGAFALWIGWVMVCFTLMTLHTAPLSRNFMFEGFQTGNENRMILGLAPDRQWLSFMSRMAQGAFCRSELNDFDPNATFLPKYAQRRSNLEKQVEATDTLRTP